MVYSPILLSEVDRDRVSAVVADAGGDDADAECDRSLDELESYSLDLDLDRDRNVEDDE